MGWCKILERRVLKPTPELTYFRRPIAVKNVLDLFVSCFGAANQRIVNQNQLKQFLKTKGRHNWEPKSAQSLDYFKKKFCHCLLSRLIDMKMFVNSIKLSKKQLIF